MSCHWWWAMTDGHVKSNTRAPGRSHVTFRILKSGLRPGGTLMIMTMTMIAAAGVEEGVTEFVEERVKSSPKNRRNIPRLKDESFTRAQTKRRMVPVKPSQASCPPPSPLPARHMFCFACPLFEDRSAKERKEGKRC